MYSDGSVTRGRGRKTTIQQRTAVPTVMPVLDSTVCPTGRLLRTQATVVILLVVDWQTASYKM